MKSEYIDVKGKWGVVYCYDLHRLDEYEIRQFLMSFGMRGGRLDEAIDVLLFHKNTGLCVSSPGLRMSLIFIGNATGCDQFWDTTAHELLYHAACAIFDYYDVPYGSEAAAWTVGYLMRKAVQVIGAPCCAEEEPSQRSQPR